MALAKWSYAHAALTLSLTFLTLAHYAWAESTSDNPTDQPPQVGTSTATQGAVEPLPNKMLKKSSILYYGKFDGPDSPISIRASSITSTEL